MNDRARTKEQLIEENADLRRQVAALQDQLARSPLAEADQQQVADQLPELVASAGADNRDRDRNAAFEQALGRSQEELRQSRERYRLAVRGAGVGLWDWDLRTGKVYYSPRWKAMFGCDEDEIGDGFDDWASRLHPEEREWIIRLQEEFLAGSALTVRAEYRLRHKDGSYRWIEAHAIVVRDEAGKAIRLVGSHADATDRKLAEEALRQSEAKYRALVESSPDAVAMCDLEMRLTFVSERAAQQLGLLAPADLLGRLATDLLVEEDRARFRANVRCLLKEGLRRNDQYLALRQDGTTFFLEVSSVVIRDADGNPEALLGVYRDITDRKQAEERLQREQQALRRMMLASDHERRLITYELHDGVAQQILGAKMLFASQQPSPENGSKAADAYREAMAALMRASSELRRVMNWLRTPVLDRFGLAQAIEDVAAQLRLAPAAPEIEYRHAIQFGRLEPTLENIVFRIAQEAMTNACRHSRSATVRVQLVQRGDAATLEVRDEGIGFDPRAVQETRFGLEGIRERARVIGGQLSIRSAPGKGTTVRLKFPVLAPADADRFA